MFDSFVKMNFNGRIFNCDYNDLTIVDFISMDNSLIHISANGVNERVLKCMKSGIGEYKERIILNLFTNKLSQKKQIKGVRLRDFKILEYSLNEIKRKNIFCDSCGLASHTISKECINNALDEFIERQSFIYSYLSKHSGKRVGKKIYSQYIHVTNEFKDIKLYDISLIPNYHVIFSMIMIRNEFWVGLGSNRKFEVAVQKSYKEIMQFYLNYKYKNNNTKDISIKNYFDLYNIIDPKRIELSYDYLNRSSCITYKDIYHNILTYNQIITELYEKCSIDPVLFYTNFYNDFYVKSCHTVDFRWFSGLLPRLYDESNYNFVESIMKTSLDRKCNFIPFP